MDVLIIEDEEFAANRLEDMLGELNYDCTVLKTIGSVKESVNWLRLHNVDLIFLDIQLSDGVCFSIFEDVEVTSPIIFTTAYDQYAIKAFQMNSIAYLLKPIKKKDLEASLQKFNTMRDAFSVDLESMLSAFANQNRTYKQRFLIRIGDVLKKIDAKQIACFFAEDKNVYLTTFNNKKLPVDYSLDRLEEELNPEQFFRINRSMIVHIESIDNMIAWTRSRVKLELVVRVSRNIDLMVSTSRAQDFKLWLNS